MIVFFSQTAGWLICSGIWERSTLDSDTESMQQLNMNSF